MLTVCIVEDQVAIRERIGARVAAMPMVRLLGTFASAEEALAGLPTLAPDLTILDIGLPGMSGTEALARLVAGGYGGGVIMFTVFEEDEHLFRALELGASGYLLKDEGPAGVQRAIEEFRDGGAPMSPRIAQRVLRSFRDSRVVGLSAKLAELTEQQYAILELLAEGLLNKEIADRLGLAEGSIKQHNFRIYRKLSVNNRAEAIRLYLTKPGA